jgi:hypothetical protein
MAADVKFRLISDDSLASDPHTLSPAVLYVGMAQAVEYHELYAQNEGDAALIGPSHTLTKVTETRYVLGSYTNRKVTDSGGTPYSGLDYSTANGGKGAIWAYEQNYVLFASTLIEASMAINQRYDLWTKHLIVSNEICQLVQFKHTIGGS